MEDIVRQALAFHNREIPILVRGERTGTGKELIARLVHYGHNDENRPFVDVNCATISPNLFESEGFLATQQVPLLAVRRRGGRERLIWLRAVRCFLTK